MEHATYTHGKSFSGEIELMATAEKKARKPRERKSLGKFPMDAKISYGTDKEGKPYSKTNNPHREGSAVRTRWEGYRSGITIKGAIEAGVRPGDILWDLKHGYISIAA